MSEEVPYHNNKDHVVTIGTKSIRPGDTRMVDADLIPEHMLKDEHKRAAKPAEPEAAPTDTLIDKNVGEIKAALAGLSDDELDQLETAELAGNTRKGALEAIAAERLHRAEAGVDE